MTVKRSFSLIVSWLTHIKTPADTTTTTTISSECPRCGTITKSGKMSCCGRGGSWVKSCGRAGKTKLQHTWYEGIQSCKSRSQPKTAIGLKLDTARQNGLDSSQGVNMVNYRAVITTTKTFPFTSANTSTPMPYTTSIVSSAYTPSNVSITTTAHTLTSTTPNNIFMTSSTDSSRSMSIITRGRVNPLKILVHINILFIIVWTEDL